MDNLIGLAARTKVVTFRLTASEYEEIETARRLMGFASIGHYARAAAITAAADVLSREERQE